MKKLSFFLMAMLFTCATTLQAAEVTETIAMKGFGGLTTASYENVTKTGTSDLGTEMVAYAFNPSTGQIRGNKTTIAGASVTSADKNKNWSLYNTQAMPGAIKKITVTQTATGSNMFKGSLFVALGTTNQGGVTTVTGAQKNTTGTATEFTFDIDETQGYTYFKLLSNVAFTGGSVAGAVVTVTYVTAEGGEEEVTKYTVTANVNDPAMGAVSGAGEYAEGKTATLTANANPGYKFVNWSNSSTDNPLKITVTEDIEITANFEAVPPMTCAEAAATADGTTIVLKPFDVVAVVKDAGYIYIEDESGVNLIYDYNLAKELKAGDHVEGFVGVSSPYNGLPELKPSVAFADLTVTPGTAPEPTLFTEAPVKADVNKYVKFENVTFTANVTYTAGSTGSNSTMVVNGTNVTVRNTFKLAATLSKDKAYNLVGFVAVYNSTIQVYFLSIEEYVAPVVNHTITVSANPAEGGVVTGGDEYEEGATAILTATANEGYEFVNWTENEVEVSTDAEYTFEVLADRALVANFEKAAPATETVYFVNALNWTGTINAYAWDPTTNADWPGVAATKEAEQIAGYDVYSYTAEAGAYKNIIFNGTGGQTADLVWTAGKYYVKDGWYTKEEAEAKLAQPIEYESVYFVDNQGWGKANIYTWTPEVGTWPGVAMTKEAEQLAGYDVYSYTVEKGTSFGGVIFNNGSSQTANLVWTAGKYYVKDGWYTKEEAIEKLSAPVTPPVITYVLMGVAGDWTTGIALTANPDNANEYVLLGQDIAEGDAVKVVTLTDGTATAWCGNVDEYSVEHSADDMGNIVLAPGKYDFYYKVTEDIIYIGGEAYKETIAYELNGGELPTATVPTQDSLIAAFKDGYNAYFGVSVATTRAIDNFLYAGAAVNVPTCDVSLFMKDDASPWKWLGDYVLAVTNAQIEAGLLVNLKELATELMWRQSLTGFFLQQTKLDSNYKGNADFTEAGKPEAWGAAYQAAHAVVLPTEPVDAPYTLPTPVKDGFTFVGWYDNAEGTGEAYTVIPAGWSGTLYAIWEVEGPATALENIAVEGKAVKAIVNGQLIIIKNGVQYNAQGQVVK